MGRDPCPDQQRTRDAAKHGGRLGAGAGVLQPGKSRVRGAMQSCVRDQSRVQHVSLEMCLLAPDLGPPVGGVRAGWSLL